jgi:hypothetical protein
LQAAAKRGACDWLQKRWAGGFFGCGEVAASAAALGPRSPPRDRQRALLLTAVTYASKSTRTDLKGVGPAFITAVGRPAPGGAYAGNRPFTRRVGVNRTTVVRSEINLLSASVDSRAWKSWNYWRGEPGFRSPYTLANPARALVLRPNRSCGYEGGKSSNNEAVRHLSPRFELKTLSQFGYSGRSSG